MTDTPAGAAAFRDYEDRRHFPGLNGLRCVAIAVVVWHHCYYGDLTPLQRGFLGVDLFFVLSGFLITTLLLRERKATGTISLRRFWIRRLLRLSPPYYALLLVLSAYYAVVWPAPHAQAFFSTLPTDALYLSNWIPSGGADLGILWSLATEQQFYLVWPLVLALAPAIAFPLLMGFLLVNQFYNLGLVGSTADPLYQLSIGQITFTPICLGVLLAGLLERPAAHLALRRFMGNPALPWLTAAASVLLALAVPASFNGWPRLAFHLLTTAFVGALLLQPEHAMTRALEHPVPARIGIVSYGIYLYHMQAIHFASQLLGRLSINSALMLALVGFLLAYLFAETSYRVLEAPVLRFAHRLRPPRRREPVPLSAA